jgi:hypothetical protein
LEKPSGGLTETPELLRVFSLDRVIHLLYIGYRLVFQDFGVSRARVFGIAIDTALHHCLMRQAAAQAAFAHDLHALRFSHLRHHLSQQTALGELLGADG